jgi:hypothetical protein
MAMDWGKVLADKAAYPDTMEITAPDGSKVPLGDVREGVLARERLLDQRAGEQAANARAIDAARQELATVYTALQAEKEDVAARAATLAATTTQGKKYDDEYLGPHLERVSALETALKDTQTQLKTALSNQMDMASRYMTKDWETAMKEIGKNLPEGVDEKYLLKYAVDNGIKDRAGLPDIRRAYETVTEPARRKKEIEDAEERGRQKERESRLAGKLGKPATMRIPPRGKATGKEFADMDEAIAEGAAHDPEILNIFAEEMGGDI